jgi:hypothetical protein
MAEKRNPYRILGVPVGANKATIENAYRQLARRYHPDLNADPGATSRMQDINWARDVLLDPHQRPAWPHDSRSDRRPYTTYTTTRPRPRTSTHTRTNTNGRAHPGAQARPNPNARPHTSSQERSQQQQRQRTTTSPPTRKTTPPRSRPANRRKIESIGCSLWLVIVLFSNVLSSMFNDKPPSSPHPPKVEILATAYSFTDYPTPDMAADWQIMTVHSMDQLLAVWEVTHGEYEWALVLPRSKVYWPAASPAEVTVCPPGVPTINYAVGKCGYFYLAQDPHFTPDDAP